MRDNRLTDTLPRTLMVLTALFALFTIMFVISPTKHAAAACINGCIPVNVQSDLSSYDWFNWTLSAPNTQCYGNPGVNYPPYYGKSEDWISLRGNSGVDDSGGPSGAITYQQGQDPTTQLQLNNLVYICHPAVVGNIRWPADTAVTPSNYTLPLNDPPVFQAGIYLPAQDLYSFGLPYEASGPAGGSISAFNAGNINIQFQQGTRFWFPGGGTTAPTFNFTPPANLGVGTYNFQINIPEQILSEFITNNGPGGTLQWNWFCVEGAQYVWSQVAQPSFSVCNTSYAHPFNLQVTVTQPPPPPALATCNPPSVQVTDYVPISNTSTRTQTESATYTVDGVNQGGVGTPNPGPVTIPMTNFDELVAHNVVVTTIVTTVTSFTYPDPNIPTQIDTGYTTTTSSSSVSVQMTPCYTPACVPVFISVDGDVIGSSDGIATNNPFQETASLKFNPINGSTNSTPTTIGGILNIFFGPLSNQTSLTHQYTNIVANFIGPPPGTYTYGYSFTDGSVTTNPNPCPGGSNLVSYHPYFSVQGGDTSVGSGGFSSSGTCNATNTKAGVLAFNNGPSGYAGQNLGSGDNLAAFSPNVVDGFETSNNSSGGYVTKLPAGLTFANAGEAAGTYDSIFFGGLGASPATSCTTDYYSKTKTIFGGGTSQSIGNGQGFDPSNPTAHVGAGACTTVSNTTYCWINGPLGLGYAKIQASAPIPAGTNLVVFVNGDAVIDGNIILDKGAGNTWTSLSKIPSFYLIAQGNIYISNTSSTTELDGVYVAQPDLATSTGGTIYTCTNDHQPYDVGPSKLYSNCDNNTLTIDGALVADQVRLDKTYGNINSSPAEKITYNPSTWMVDPFYNTSAPINPSYESITALPPVL